jgi:hypothetical protein
MKACCPGVIKVTGTVIAFIKIFTLVIRIFVACGTETVQNTICTSCRCKFYIVLFFPINKTDSSKCIDMYLASVMS